MATAKKRRLRINQRAVKDLQAAYRAARLDRCSVDVPHDLRLYLSTWIVGPIARALKEIGAGVPAEVTPLRAPPPDQA
jgi:hypothetical protein